MFKGGMGNMMKQAQQMQDRMQKVQDDLAKLEVTGEAGAGMVKVTMTCNHNVRRVDIDDTLMEDDKDMIEDLVAAAFNDAVRRVQETSKEKWVTLLAECHFHQASKCRFNVNVLVTLTVS